MQQIIGQKVQQDNLKSLFQLGNGYQQTFNTVTPYQITTGTFSLTFRIGLDNEKIERNPAARIRRKTEGGGRVRFLSDTEEKRLRAAIERRFAEFLPHFLLSILTGMRMSEQYCLRWNQVDFERRQLRLIRMKNGDSRAIPLNTIALGALQVLRGEQTLPRLPFRAHRRCPPRIAWMVIDRPRRGQD